MLLQRQNNVHFSYFLRFDSRQKVDYYSATLTIKFIIFK